MMPSYSSSGRTALLPIALVAVISVMALAANPSLADDHGNLRSFEIEASSPTGFFLSPAYMVTIRGDGTVLYRGYDNVHVKGNRQGKVTIQEVAALADHVRASGFLDLTGVFPGEPCSSIDVPVGGLRVRLDGREKAVTTCKSPMFVYQLLNETFQLARAWRWVVYDPKKLRHDIAHGWRVADHMPQIMDSAIDWDADEIIDILARHGAALNGDNDFLIRAISDGHVNAVRTLLQSGADWKCESRDADDCPPIFAAAVSTAAMLKLFLDVGTDPNLVSSDGETMLIRAAYLGNADTVKLLVDSGAKVNMRDPQGETALDRALRGEREYAKVSPEIARRIQSVIEYLQSGDASKNSLPQQTSEAPKKQILNKDQAEILVFEYCSASDRSQSCPIEVVYTLSHEFPSGILQVFDLLAVDGEFPLPDLSAGRHVTTLPHEFYWKEQEETFPDPMFFCNLGTVSTTDLLSNLWGPRSDASAYDYKPAPSDKINGVQYDQAGQFRGNDLGFSSFLYPAKKNFERRERGELPEVEILGAGFVEGTNIQCGRGVNPTQLYPAPLRDVRVVSVASHKANPDMPVLKAARFTMPKNIFQYPNHIRIVATLK